MIEKNTELLLLTHFVDEKPVRVFINPASISMIEAYGSMGKDSGVDILFKDGSTCQLAIWDTHLAYALAERCNSVDLQVFDRRDEKSEIDDYLEATFNIKPREDRKEKGDRTPSFKSKKEETRESSSENDSGRGSTCSMCEDEVHPDNIGLYEDDEGMTMRLCEECVEAATDSGAVLTAKA